MKWCGRMNKVALALFLTLDTTCWSFHPLTVTPFSSRVNREGSSGHLLASGRDFDESASGEDWRDVRAKLVMQYSHGEDLTEKGSNSTSATAITLTKAVPTDWAYDSKGAIEVGTLLVSHPSQDSACGGLRRQHFHKCIVLVIDHSKEGTKGVILNRPTNQIISGKEENGWKSFFGGNTQGIGSEDESLGCLCRRNKSSPVKNGMSLPLLKDIEIMPWDIAKALVDENEETKEDFRLYHGYTTWGPGRLEKELDRGDWFTVATDAESLWKIIAEDSSFSTGTDKWVQLMNRIGKQSLISSVPNQKFQDDMLKQYMRLRLLQKTNDGLRTTSDLQKPDETKTSKHNLVPGTLVRSSTPIFLEEQVFHQSLVLILKNDDEMTIGVVLNRPYSTSVSIGDTTLPVRYGGRFELDDEGLPEIWLHCNHETLQEARVGGPVSEDGHPDSIFWQCTRKDAEAAVEAGLANADDFLVVSGLSVWNKESTSNGAGGASTLELDDHFCKVDEKSIGIIWKLLQVQEPLNKKNAAENLEAANTAWMLSGDAGWMLSGGSRQSNARGASDMDSKEQQVVQSLAYSALDKWIKMYLLKP